MMSNICLSQSIFIFRAVKVIISWIAINESKDIISKFSSNLYQLCVISWSQLILFDDMLSLKTKIYFRTK